MDSMRSLNTSLPASTPRPQPPEQLLQAFKTAALSVTNLYKNAVSDQAQARQAGYQDALEDLLAFLDRENLGLSDGEGWRIRQWATERADGTGTAGSDSDDERGDTDKHARSCSPAVMRKENQEPEHSRQMSRSSSPPRVEPAVQQQQQPQQPMLQPQPQPAGESNIFARPTTFTFTAGPSFPQPQEQDIDMQSSDNPMTMSTTSQDDTQTCAPAVSVSVLPRNSRAQSRHNSVSRHNARSSTRESSAGLGSKRKFNLPDFFDISGLGNTRDIFGGGKRGRFT
ncbi:hypothetical protein VTN00DRAFT_5695 [Thermoascus crustaceus]|uniref:uncharacterized protein n=1 Tax=Thermoascus crustaceus TaxID=5088 RepID=UPI0037439E15